MSGVGTVRRYLLLKEKAALKRDEESLARAFRGKRNAESGTDLPATFPGLTELAAATPPYTTVEDLKGPTTERSADVEELRAAGLQRKVARAVIAALEDI